MWVGKGMGHKGRASSRASRSPDHSVERPAAPDRHCGVLAALTSLDLSFCGLNDDNTWDLFEAVKVRTTLRSGTRGVLCFRMVLDCLVTAAVAIVSKKFCMRVHLHVRLHVQVCVGVGVGKCVYRC